MRRRVSMLSWSAALALTAMAVFGGALAPRAQTPAPERIVAAGGVITEIIYALGMQDKLAGIDTTSLYPENALQEKPNIGYVRALSAEGVLSLKPSVVIAIEGAGPLDVVKLIEEAGVRIAHLPEDLTANGVVDRIRRVGALAGAAARGEALANETAARFRDLDAARARIAKPKRVLFALSLQNGRVMAGGRNSSADAIIRLAGGVNAADQIDGYKPMNDEAVIAASPDLIIVMNRGQHTATAEQVFGMPAFATTPAAKTNGFVAMDGLYLLGFGPRTPDAARDLMQALYGAGIAGKS